MSRNEEKNEDFSTRMQRNMKVLAECIRTSSVLPVGSSWDNLNTCFPSFSAEMKRQSDQVLLILSTLLIREGVKQNIKNCNDEEKIDLVVDGVNKILDRVGDNLNLLNGGCSKSSYHDCVKTKEKLLSGSWNKGQSKSNRSPNFVKSIPIVKVSEKPQLKFEVKVDNSNSSFQPQLSVKPNAIKPLSIYLERDLSGYERYCHPYMHELNCFVVPESQLGKVEPILPTDMNSTQPTYVDDEKSLERLLSTLQNEKEIAIDLEYHSYRSFHGFTCLLQISTRREDFIVDAISLRSKLHILNEIFTNPSILKVLHGASSDIVWLQKDLNLYIVNMFDTHLASLTLDYPRLSLAFLLKHYCNVDADKRYQLFDWRIRPLPETALEYARSDTHYLLHIYDQLRNALLSKTNDSTNLLLSVYSRSTDLCKKRYEKVFDKNEHLILYKQSKQTFDNRQMHALKLLYQWRDEVAREKDESTGYVLPNHMMLQIAEILPREFQGVLACCNPVPPLVRLNLAHLHSLIVEARTQPANKVANSDTRESLSLSKAPVLSRLRCPHDFSYHDDFRDNLSTLLDGCDIIDESQDGCQLKIPVFDDENNQPLERELAVEKPMLAVTFKTITFTSPYERYRRTSNFVISDSKRNAEELLPASSPNSDVVNITNSSTQKIDSDDEENVILFKAPNSREKIVQESSSAVDCGVRRKRALCDQVPNKKMVKNYEAVTKVIVAPSSDVRSELEMCQRESDGFAPSTEKNLQALHPTKRSNGRKNKDALTSRGEKSAHSFTPFDYSQANFNQFVTSGPKNLKKLLSSKISFGVKKKAQNYKLQRKKKY